MKYIFGYESLIYPPGINGRKMKYTYTEKDLIIAKLKGYQRCWNVSYNPHDILVYQPPEWTEILFLGITKSDCHYVNGIIFPISEEDIRQYLDSTGAYDNPSMYTLENVTSLIDSPLILTPEDRIFTCVTVNPMAKGLIKSFYIDHIRKGLMVRGKSFKQEFIKTTFPNMPKGYYDFGYKS